MSAIAERSPGSSVLDVFRAMTHTVLDVLVAGGDEDLRAVATIIRGSSVLQERLTVGWESGAAALTAVIAETSGARGDDLMPAIVARTLWFTHRSIFRAALGGLLAEEEPEQLAARAARRPTSGRRGPGLRPPRRWAEGVRQGRPMRAGGHRVRSEGHGSRVRGAHGAADAGGEPPEPAGDRAPARTRCGGGGDHGATSSAGSGRPGGGSGGRGRGGQWCRCTTRTHGRALAP